MHGSFRANADLLAALLDGVGGVACDVAICPPYPYLAQVASLLEKSPVVCGAQNLSEFAGGAYTGEVSAAMLVDAGCSMVIVGHSERRSLYGESDGQVAAKCRAALAAGLMPVLCVGETLAEREAGQTLAVVARQLAVVLEGLASEQLQRMVVAYEPVWAIGTGLTATPVQAQEVHAAIRAQLAALDADVAAGVRILYGGSVKPGNAAELFVQPDIDGGLIGGAALVAEDFLAICQAASR